MKAPFVPTLWSHCPPKPTPLALLSAPATLTSQRLAVGSGGGRGRGQPEIHLLQISYKSSDRFTSRWLWLSFQFRFYSPLPRTSGILASSCGPGRKSPLGVLPQRRSSPITCAPLNLIRAGRRMPDTNTINQRVLKEGSAPRLFPSVFLAANAFRRSSEHIH